MIIAILSPLINTDRNGHSTLFTDANLSMNGDNYVKTGAQQSPVQKTSSNIHFPHRLKHVDELFFMQRGERPKKVGVTELHA